MTSPTEPSAERRGTRPGFPRRDALIAVAALALLGSVALLVYGLAGSGRAGAGIAGSSRSGGAAGQGLDILAAGTVAPGFQLPRLGGGPPVSLAAERGHPVVINFFASWCPECRAELRAFARASANAGTVRFLGVDTNDTEPGTAEALLRSAGVRYPVGVDRTAATASGDYLIQALPATVFVYPDGRIAGHAYGAQTPADLEAWLARLGSATP